MSDKVETAVSVLQCLSGRYVEVHISFSNFVLYFNFIVIGATCLPRGQVCSRIMTALYLEL